MNDCADETPDYVEKHFPNFQGFVPFEPCHQNDQYNGGVCVCVCVSHSGVSYLGYLVAQQLCVLGGGVVDAERRNAAETLRLLDHCLRAQRREITTTGTLCRNDNIVQG